MIFCSSHLAASRPAAVLDPACPAHRADARRLLEVREVFLRDGSEDKVRHISTADGTRLFTVERKSKIGERVREGGTVCSGDLEASLIPILPSSQPKATRGWGGVGRVAS